VTKRSSTGPVSITLIHSLATVTDGPEHAVPVDATTTSRPETARRSVLMSGATGSILFPLRQQIFSLLIRDTKAYAVRVEVSSPVIRIY